MSSNNSNTAEEKSQHKVFETWRGVTLVTGPSAETSYVDTNTGEVVIPDIENSPGERSSADLFEELGYNK